MTRERGKINQNTNPLDPPVTMMFFPAKVCSRPLSPRLATGAASSVAVAVAVAIGSSAAAAAAASETEVSAAPTTTGAAATHEVDSGAWPTYPDHVVRKGSTRLKKKCKADHETIATKVKNTIALADWE